MALRDQPYLPLYVRDFSADEKLRNCSAESVGVYIMVMCFLHMSPTYGSVTLLDRHKKSSDNIKNFACLLLRQLPFEIAEIERGLRQLVEENVLSIEGDTLFQKRMVRDGEISEKRAIAGAAGGTRTQSNAKIAKANLKQTESTPQAKIEQNTEIEIEYENEIEGDSKKRKKKKETVIPTREQVRDYARERNSDVDPDRFYDYFNEGGWIDSNGKPVLSWKQKFITWEKNGRKGEMGVNGRARDAGNNQGKAGSKWNIQGVPID